ncbi:hypothetical protein [Endozoicomonas arenosclerae]|uniref:hypothetical protein n=1 Tax=Endozoicomonas arenosclerae TaxID=1633495 RepID=UPI000784EA60|nr:hypothetical protein [Endozoicomonas arenosclerae]
MNVGASVNSLPVHTKSSSVDGLSPHAPSENGFNQNNSVNRAGNRVFSDSIKKLDSRSIAEFDNLSVSPPELEAPATDVSDLLEEFEVINEYPDLPANDSSSEGVLGWLKDAASFLIHYSTLGHVPKRKKQTEALVQLIPEVCEQIVRRDQSAVAPPSASRAALHRPSQTPVGHPVRIRRQLLMPEQVWKQKEIQKELALQEEQRKLAIELEALAKESMEAKEPIEPPMIDVMTGMPVPELESKVWEFLVKSAEIMSPAGGKVKGAATHVVSEEKVDQLQALLKNVMKDRVHYEISKNLGRRILQVAAVCGSASPLLPALTLLGYTIPGCQFIPAMLALWRLKDFKDEVSALYYDRNAAPALIDLTMSWAPTLVYSLLGM